MFPLGTGDVAPLESAVRGDGVSRVGEGGGREKGGFPGHFAGGDAALVEVSRGRLLLFRFPLGFGCAGLGLGGEVGGGCTVIWAGVVVDSEEGGVIGSGVAVAACDGGGPGGGCSRQEDGGVMAGADGDVCWCGVSDGVGIEVDGEDGNRIRIQEPALARDLDFERVCRGKVSR